MLSQSFERIKTAVQQGGSFADKLASGEHFMKREQTKMMEQCQIAVEEEIENKEEVLEKMS